MLYRKDIQKVLREVAEKMNTGEQNAFRVICSSCEQDPIEMWRDFKEGKPTPEWWISRAIDIMTNKVYLLNGVARERRNRKNPNKARSNNL